MKHTPEQDRLIEFLKSNGYQGIRVLQDGTIVAWLDLAFTRAILMGLNWDSWDSRFCFDDRDLALQELDKLTTGNDRPKGWIARRGVAASEN